MNLCDLRCSPCKGGVAPMTRAVARQKLVEVPGWELDEPAATLARRFSFKTFVQALKFANQVGDLAEKEGHHPELTVGWGFCLVVYYTQKIRGLHENDFIMAAKTSLLFQGTTGAG